MHCSNTCCFSLIDWQELEYYFLYLGIKKCTSWNIQIIVNVSYVHYKLFFHVAYDKVCLSDVLEKWKQAAADGDVVIIHKPHEKSENPYLPFVGKYNMVVYYLYLLSLIFIHFYYPTPSYVLQIRNLIIAFSIIWNIIRCMYPLVKLSCWLTINIWYQCWLFTSMEILLWFSFYGDRSLLLIKLLPFCVTTTGDNTNLHI